LGMVVVPWLFGFSNTWICSSWRLQLYKILSGLNRYVPSSYKTIHLGFNFSFDFMAAKLSTQSLLINRCMPGCLRINSIVLSSFYSTKETVSS
jgi:hypothetical protein